MPCLIALLGCGYHARGVAAVLLDNDPDATLIFIDEKARPNEKIMGFDVVREIPASVDKFVLGAGDNFKRRKWADGKIVASVIAKDAVICPFSKIGDGSFLAHGSFVGSEVRLGKGTILNTHAVIEHNAVIGDFCNIAPNATILGQCIIGDNVSIGAGAVIRNNVKICSDVAIGMGAVVVKDITEAGTYVGCPARKIKDHA